MGGHTNTDGRYTLRAGPHLVVLKYKARVLGSGEGEDCVGSLQRELIVSVPWQLLSMVPL